MANTIQIKRRSTTGAPTAGQLEQGELAINLLDEKLYSKNSSNAIFEIGGYTHPSDGGGNQATLTGAQVYSDIAINTAGHVTSTTVRSLNLNNLSDVTITSVGEKEILNYDSGQSEWINLTPAQLGLLTTTQNFSGDVTGPYNATVVGNNSHTHTGSTISALDAGDTTTGTFANARISAASVTQHQASLGAEASTVSTLVRRNSSGDINVRLLRSEYDSTNATIGFIMTQIDTASNNFVRPSTPAQLTAGLPVATTSVKGLLPTLGGGTTNFLRADGTWAAPVAGSIAAANVLAGNLVNGVKSYYSTSDNDVDYVVPFTDASAGANGNYNLKTHLEKNNGMKFNPQNNVFSVTTIDCAVANLNSSDTVQVNGSGIHCDDNLDLFLGTSDDAALYFNGTDLYIDTASTSDIRMRIGSSNAIICNNGSSVDFYHAGGLEARTQQHEGSSITSGLEVYDHAGTLRDVGFNHVKEVVATSVTLSNLHAGCILKKTGTGTITITMAASSTEFPIGSMCTILNHGTGGSVTISDGSEAMYIMDGGGTPTDSTGFVLAVGGVITVWRQGLSAYYVWGAGIP